MTESLSNGKSFPSKTYSSRGDIKRIIWGLGSSCETGKIWTNGATLVEYKCSFVLQFSPSSGIANSTEYFRDSIESESHREPW